MEEDSEFDFEEDASMAFGGSCLVLKADNMLQQLVLDKLKLKFKKLNIQSLIDFLDAQ